MPRNLTRRRTAEPETSKPDMSAHPSNYEPIDDVADNKDAAEDSAPRGRRTAQAASKVTKPEVAHGWDAADKLKADGGDFPDDLRVTDEAVLVHFLDPDPFAVYKQHWIERQGKKSFTCLGDDCPLCDDVGDRPGTKITFNVVDFTDLDKPKNAIWTVGSRVATTLKNYSLDKKVGPLDRDDLYFSASKSGKGTNTVYVVNPVKARDLAEDWDIEPLSKEEINEFSDDAYGPEIVEFQNKHQLSEIATELTGA